MCLFITSMILKKYFRLTLLYIIFNLVSFCFYLLFIRTEVLPNSNDESDFIIKLFKLLLLAIFLFKENSLKNMIFLKIPQKTDIIKMFLTLIIYVLFVITNTIFFYYNHSINPSKIFSLGIINAVLLAPIIEEIIFRGVMINYLLPANQNKKWHIVLCFVFISLLFSLIHNNVEFYHFIHHFIFSFIISILYYYQRNIYTVIFFHILYNLFTITFNSYQLDLTQQSLNKEWYFIGSLIFLGLTIYTLFRLAKSYRNQ